ncbi:MAG: hypothetical protein M3O30_05780 [Planctomycetota bacterium]|nr:hypothetical protein [Planctomycetota bacterium]
MWGNQLGWKISAAIALASLAFWLWLSSVLGITPRTQLSLDPQNMALMATPQLIGHPPFEQNDPGDAGPDYRRATAKYDQESTRCDEFSRAPTGPPPASFQIILAAAGKTKMNLFAGSPSEIIDYQGFDQHLVEDHLFAIAHAMARAGVAFKINNDLSSARQYLRAVYAVGANLYRERLDFVEFSDGVALIDEAIIGLEECEPPDSAARNPLELGRDDLIQHNSERLNMIYKPLSSADPEVIATNAGDVFAFAVECKERMFRVEAILKLGRYRFNAARKGDQLAAGRYLRKLAKDPDLVIATAAIAARDLTLEQYRMIH